MDEIVIFYPSQSLNDQVARCAREHGQCCFAPAHARSAFEVRKVIQGASMVIVDATEDHAQAIQAFSQALAHFGPDRVALYTERMHDGLELFVRTQGAPLLFGPLCDAQWNDFLQRSLTLRQPCRLRPAA